MSESGGKMFLKQQWVLAETRFSAQATMSERGKEVFPTISAKTNRSQ